MGMTIALPGMTAAATKLAGTVVATGGAACAGVDAFFAAGKLTLTFNGAVDTVAANKYCTYTAKAITTSKAYVAANAATRTAAVKIAAASDIAAAKITTSTITGTAPTPTPAKTSGASYTSGGTPTPATTSKHHVEAQVQLTGISKDEFDKTAQDNFKSVIGDNMKPKVDKSKVTITKVTDVTRRAKGIKVDFKVAVKDAETAKSQAATLTTFMKDAAGFKKALVAKGGALAKVTGTKVTKEPKATTTSTVSGVAKTATMSLISMVSVAFALLR